mgnify:CR=1 FL=1
MLVADINKSAAEAIADEIGYAREGAVLYRFEAPPITAPE